MQGLQLYANTGRRSHDIFKQGASSATTGETADWDVQSFKPAREAGFCKETPT